jgi:transposase
MAPSYDIATRSQILTLKLVGLSDQEIAKKLGILVDRSTIRRLWDKAVSRGWDPGKTLLLDSFLENAPRSGRPTKQTKENKAKVESLVVRDRYAREKTAQTIADEIAGEVGVSATTVKRIMKKLRFRKTKPTRKPGLTKAMRQERLAWCKAHDNLPDEFWHNVIWTDETSILLGHRRGGYKVWRRP